MSLTSSLMRCQPFGYVWVKLLFFFASSCSLEAFLSISCISFCLSFLFDVLRLRSYLSLRVFLIGHFCPIIGLVVSHVQTHADTSCVLTCGHQLCPIRKNNSIKISNLLFSPILFYENQQTTPKFKVAPSLRSGILRSGFAIGDRVSGLTLTIKMPFLFCIW